MNEPICLKKYLGKSYSFRNYEPEKFLGNSNFIINGFPSD